MPANGWTSTSSVESRMKRASIFVHIDRIPGHLYTSPTIMPRLFDTIRSLVLQNRYIVGEHATERLDERGILEWQVVDGIERGELIVERLDSKPNPAVEVRQFLVDGTEIKAVWSHLISVDIAKLVTIHFFDE